MSYDEYDRAQQMKEFKSLEDPASREELEEKIAELETEIVRLDFIIAGQAYDQSELYKNLVKDGKNVCSGCANALWTATNSNGNFTFESCLISNIDVTVYQCNQFKPSEYPIK